MYAGTALIRLPANVNACEVENSRELNRVAASFLKELYGPSSNTTFTLDLNNSWYDKAVKLCCLKDNIWSLERIIFNI